MGNVSFGAPKEIIEKMRATFGLDVFVETGTYMGGTAAWASERFAQVYTVEGSPDYRRQAQERHADKRNIEFLLGDSRAVLSEIVGRLGEKAAVFWLDAHWMPGSFGEAHECPLLEEIAAIQQSPTAQFILIDDARLFLAPPPRPHRAADWPDLAEVLSALERPGQQANYTVVLDDVIISLPATTREPMRDFFQGLTTAAIEAEATANALAGHPLRRLKRFLRRLAGRP